MTGAELQEIRKRCEQATPGAWSGDEEGVSDDTDQPLFYCSYAFRDDDDPQVLADATFVAFVRTDIPVLLAEVDRLRKMEENVKQLFEPVRLSTEPFEATFDDFLSRMTFLAAEGNDRSVEVERLRAENERLRFGIPLDVPAGAADFAISAARMYAAQEVERLLPLVDRGALKRIADSLAKHGVPQRYSPQEELMIRRVMVEQEREACAKVAENYYGHEPGHDYNQSLKKAGNHIAAAIRARSGIASA